MRSPQRNRAVHGAPGRRIPVRHHSPVLFVGRSVLALFSVAVLLVAGYAWINYHQLARTIGHEGVAGTASPDGSLDVLLVGLDSRTDAQGRPLPDDVLRRLRAGDNAANLTDTVMLLHIPEDGAPARAFSFPRDAFVSVPGHGQHKINSAFGRGKRAAAVNLDSSLGAVERERRSSEAGRQLLLRTVEHLSGVSVDHYAEVNLLGFHELTQVVGGVPVCLKEATSDEYSGARFVAGRQLVSGSDALAFVRQRHGLPRGDLDRVVRQQAFLAGLVRSLLTNNVLLDPPALSRLVDAAERTIVLDRDWDLLGFARRMGELAGGSVSFRTIPIADPAYSTREGMAVRVDPVRVRHSIREPEPVAAPPTNEDAAGARLAPISDGAGESEGAAPAPSGPTRSPAISTDDVPCVN